LVGFANPIFAWIGVIALLLFLLSLMWKAVKTAVFFVLLGLIAWIVFFAG
jgi:hypothetical protein